jgi:hypothetical protein
MQVMREPTGMNVFPLDTSAARGTVPHSNPWVVGTGQTKEHNTVISALQRRTSSNTYHWMFDNFQWTNSRLTPPGYINLLLVSFFSFFLLV